jgi:hypothetical protein
LVIDCESQDGSVDHFMRLMSRYEFDLISAPLRAHGLTLDWLFESIADDQLLLIDSDLELKDSRIIEFFNEFIDEPTVFGCGFTNGPGWLSDKVFAKTDVSGALFHERPWMPLTLLKTAYIREALALDKSFVAARFDNDYTLVPSFARRHVRRLLKQGPEKLRRNFYCARPAVVFYDTGAQMFEHLRYERCLYFVGLPEPIHPRYVTHFCGVTRHALNPQDMHGGDFAGLETYIRERLEASYHESF